MTNAQRRLEYIKIAEQILQKQFMPGSPAYGVGGVPCGSSDRVVIVRSVAEVLTAAEQVRAWCEDELVFARKKRISR